ncbi:MAG TPA: acetyltransferase [Gammaproteobacteria bacterium]|nr:acetyltransferase [Gammaproteobacteria bacterium]
MFLKDKATGDLVEVLNTNTLVDPCRAEVQGRFHAGEEMQEPREFAKADLVFPSGEPLPRCWVDPHYRD